MSRAIKEPFGLIRLGVLAGFILLLPLMIAVAHAETSLNLGFQEVNSANESNRTAFLTWVAEADSLYRVQSSTNPADPAAWKTEDAVVRSSAGPLKWMAPESIDRIRFYRLLLPQPEIITVEPAVIQPGVPVDLHVIGQGLSSNDVLRINGELQTNVAFLSSSLLSRPAFTPDKPGTYQFELVVADQVVSAFQVTCADGGVNPELVLQGPPEEPPASPSARWLSKKGYDYYRAQSDLLHAGAQTNPYFHSNGLEGEMIATCLAAFLSKKGYDYYKAQSDLSNAGAQTNPYFHENSNAGEMMATCIAAFLSKKGYDYYQTRRAISPPSGAARWLKGGGASVGKANPGRFASSLARSDGGGASVGKAQARFASSLAGFGGASVGGIAGGVIAGIVVAAREAGGDDCDDTDPGVVPFSGEVQQQVVDLAVEGRRLDFIWARTYHSRLARFDASANGWTYSYDVHCAQNPSGGIDVYDGTGRKDTFTLQTNGTYTCPGLFRELTFIASSAVVRVTFADSGFWEFNPFDGTSSAGKLARIVDRNHNAMLLSYDGASGQLTQIVDDLGRTNTVSYDAAGRVASVTDFSGRTVAYAYYQGGETGGSPGDLKSVTSPPVTGTPNGNDFPKGKTTTYTYSTGYLDERENHLLLSMSDANGLTVHKHVYQHNQTDLDFLRCISVQRWTNTPAILTYLSQTPSPSNQFAVLRCVMNDPEGDVTEEFYDARGRCVTEREFTGRTTPGQPVTDTVNRPAGKLRVEDPDYYESQWTWNNDSLLKLLRPHSNIVQLAGRVFQYTYESDFAPSTSARKRADLRVVREVAAVGVDLDGDGVADVIDRTWRFEYDPRFGSDSAAGHKGWDGTIKGNRGPRQTVSLDGSFLGSDSMAGASKNWLPSNFRVEIDGLSASRKGWDGTIKGNRGPRQSVSLDGSFLAGDSTASASKNWLPSNFRVEIDGLSASRKGWDGTIKGNRSFALHESDPRGHVTESAYDTQGNRVWRIRKRPELLYAQTEVGFSYDDHGQLVAITNAPDANGYRRVDTISYFADGPQAGYLRSIVIDEPGMHITSTFERDLRGNATRVIDPLGNDWLYTFNALDQCVRAQSPVNLKSRCATDFSYDANNNLVQCSMEVRDATDGLLGSRADYCAYDALGRPTEISLAVDAKQSLTHRFVYDGNDQCIQELGGDAVAGADPHQTVSYQYDERGLLFRRIFAAGAPEQSTDQFDYSAARKLAALHNGLEGGPDSLCSFAYDGFDRPSLVTDPMGNQLVCFHDVNDNLKAVRILGEMNDVPGAAGNVRLAEARYNYDSVDCCVVSHGLFFDIGTQLPLSDGECTTVFAFAPNGQLISVTDDLGHATTYACDTAGRPSSVTDALGNRRSVMHDAASNPLYRISEEQPAAGGALQVFSVTNMFDSLGRCVSSTDCAGNSSGCAYDSLGRCVRTVDARGVHAFYRYDLLGRCTVAVGDLDGDGLPDLARDITTTFAWSGTSGNLLAVTDSNTNMTRYSYDSLGRCAVITMADGTQEKLVWSPRSNLVGEEDANGVIITNSYDLNNRIIHRDLATRFEAFAYDGCGRMIGGTNNDCSVSFAFDSLGHCVAEKINDQATVSTCDAQGNRLSLTYPSKRTLAYSYDALNRCVGISDSGALLAAFAYNGPDRIARIDYGNGTRARFSYDGLAGTPNAAGDYGFGQVNRIRHDIPGTQFVVDDRTFMFDPMQNKTSRAMSAPFTLAGAAQYQLFDYDLAGRMVLSQVMTNGSLTRGIAYGFDREGNRTKVTGADCSGDYTMDSASPPADFEMNQYTTTPCDARTYDDNGNLIGRNLSSGTALAYNYDYADRLVSVSDSGMILARYAYDALGRRVSKTIFSGGAVTTTQFFHDGDNVIEEQSGAETATTYVAGPSCGSGACLALRREGQDYFIHRDDQGNALALTTGGGTVVERYDYDDYGAATFLTSDGLPTAATTSSVGQVYCWGSLRLDAETGLLCNDGGDYFEPETGRTIRGRVNLLENTNGRFPMSNNPWSDGEPGAMKKGVVKFFNEAKSF